MCLPRLKDWHPMQKENDRICSLCANLGAKEKERNEKLEKEIIQLKKKNKKLMKQLEEYKELQVKQQQPEYPER